MSEDIEVLREIRDELKGLRADIARMPSDEIKLHASLIRSMRGVINAWEEYALGKLPVEENPDPVKHFNRTRR